MAEHTLRLNLRGKRNLALVGFMGAGKTAVGRLLAPSLGLHLVDFDQAIEAQEDRAIARIFEEEGEAYFRRLEEALTLQCCLHHGLLLVPGGGALLSPLNRKLLHEAALWIWLKVGPETARQRLLVAGLEDRPLLRGTDPLWRIRELMEEREPSYQEADWVVETEGKGLAQVVEEVRDFLHQAG